MGWTDDRGDGGYRLLVRGGGGRLGLRCVRGGGCRSRLSRGLLIGSLLGRVRLSWCGLGLSGLLGRGRLGRGFLRESEGRGGCGKTEGQSHESGDGRKRGGMGVDVYRYAHKDLERTLTGFRFIFSRNGQSFIPEVLALSLEQGAKGG